MASRDFPSRPWPSVPALFAIALAGIAACAQVPRESVELSATVGRDIVEVHRAHRELVKLLFARMRADVNRFVDTVYAPHQIHAAMTRQMTLAESSDPEEQKKSLLRAVNAAFQEGAAPDSQAKVLAAFEFFVKSVHDDVENFRAELLTPLAKQEQSVLDSVERAYVNIQYANSIVTGHLASIVKVHDAQADLLAAVGVPRDLRAEVGGALANASNRVNELVNHAQRDDAAIKSVTEELKKLTEHVADSEGG